MFVGFGVLLNVPQKIFVLSNYLFSYLYNEQHKKENSSVPLLPGTFHFNSSYPASVTMAKRDGLNNVTTGYIVPKVSCFRRSKIR